MFIITRLQNRRNRLKAEKSLAKSLLAEEKYCFAGEEIVRSTPYRIISTTYRHGQGQVVAAWRSWNGYMVQLTDGQLFRVRDVQERRRPESSWKRDWDENGFAKELHFLSVEQILAPSMLDAINRLELAQQRYEIVIEGSNLPAEDPMHSDERSVAYAAEQVRSAKDHLRDIKNLPDEALRVRRAIDEAFNYDQSRWYGHISSNVLDGLYSYERFLDANDQRALDILRARASYSARSRNKEWRGVNLADAKYFQPMSQAKYDYDQIMEAIEKLNTHEALAQGA